MLAVFDKGLHPELEQHFSGSEWPEETNYDSIHMKQTSDRRISHPNQITGLFFTKKWEINWRKKSMTNLTTNFF